MPRLLKNLRIDEVSCTIRGANPGAKVMIRKSDDAPQGPLLFDDIMRKADDEPADKKLSTTLNELVAAMVEAHTGLHPQRAARWLLTTSHGREMIAQHMKKKETPMPQVDILKLRNSDSVIEFIKSSGASEHVIHDVIMGHAKLNKRDGESDAQAFARFYPMFYKASMTPTTTSVGNTLVADDSAEAVRQLTEMAEQTGESFEVVFAAPENKELAARTYRIEQRPNISSTSGY